MEKINIKDLNLTVKSVEHKMFNQDCLYEAVKYLIKRRINHCKEQLDFAIHENHAFQRNHSDSQYIVYIGPRSGQETGHFSVPVYNHMIEWLNNESSTYDKCIIQQALRQLYSYELEKELRIILNKYDYSDLDLFNTLTEMIVVL